jgi:NAD(P)-dependent dehydrogenase (short-subunit alcohol dehydrogenase family)
MPTVFITGANRGLGFEFARQYAAAGWIVHATARNLDSARPLLNLAAHVHIADMRETSSLKRLSDELGGAVVDLLICNAGVYEPRDTRFGHTDYQAWSDAFRVNVIAPMATIEALAENVAASQLKTIVLVSSGAGSLAQTGGREYIYGSSKAALNSVARSCAGLLRERGVCVIAVSPGWCRTDMGGPNASLDPAYAISRLIDVIAGLRLEDSGCFLNYSGEEIPW